MLHGTKQPQGVPAANLTATGFGKADPVESNSTAAGRQQNRRVEMVIAGEVIGIAATLAPSD
jgi:outer membrane protein OmpA-like peptidoglycan-associated protein